MLTINILNDQTGTDDSANYTFDVLVNGRKIDGGVITGHNRKDDWRSLLQRMLYQNRPQDPSRLYENRMCIAKDDDGHAYIIPVDKRMQFYSLLVAISKSDDAPEWEQWYAEMEQYRTHIALSCYSFENVKDDL